MLNLDALKAWQTWRAMSPHGPLSKLGMTRAHNQLLAMGDPQVQWASVQQSIHHGWRGLFVPRGTFAVQVDLSGVELS